MKAITYSEYGSPDVLRCEEIEKPAPADDEVLIKVRAASLNPLDWRMLRGKPYLLRAVSGLSKPKTTRPGVDVAGQIDAVGGKAVRFKPGDEVFGACRGALAEYACASESKVVTKPVNVTFEQAASAPVAALTALQGLRDYGKIQSGYRVLINGAAGGVGTFAVQIARSLGAEVTGVCSTRNLEFVRSIGADHVVDYTQQDFTGLGRRYDIIFDCIENHSLSARRRILNRNGVCVMVGAPHDRGWLVFLGRLIKAPIVSRFSSRKAVMFIAKPNKEDLAVIGELMATGKLKPVIDRSYPLSAAADAMRYLEQGHARGKVIITVS